MNRHPSQRGAALVEFALVLPFFLLLMVITTEFGRAIYQYNTIAKSVRDASRYLSMQSPGTGGATAASLVVYGSAGASGSATPLVPGLSLANVAAPVWQIQGSDPAIRTVTVTVTGYCFAPMISSVFGVAIGSAPCGIPFGNISATMRAPT